MSRLASLKAAKTLGDLARLLEFKPAGLSYILFKLPAAGKYRTFQIPKRAGGRRTIKAPIDQLKLLQRKLSLLLQDCLDEINEAKQRKDKVAHGFKRKRSIITNATQHRHRRYIFNIDLEDFFPSINFGRVRGFFIRDNNFALHKEVATAIAQIACHDNALPQGSPCSPVVSNLIGHVLDMHMVRLASAAGCTYSRYADDLTFSTNQKTFPCDIAKQDSADLHLWTPGAELERRIMHAGFRINPSKTRMQYRTSRQDVTGLVVNQKINVRREYRHNVRAMVHRLFSTGKFEILGSIGRGETVTIEKREGTLNELHGRLAFIDSIDVFNKRSSQELQKLPHLSKKEGMYRQFLIYKDFYSAERPVILCEGETDIVYLYYAIRSLAAQFPELAEVASDGKVTLKVRLYKYTKSSTARILGLNDGGNTALHSFIATYKRDTARFKAPGQRKPVVVLYDNDSGAGKIQSAIAQIAKTKPKGQPYVRVVGNLYAMPTPLPTGAQESKIEDFFDASTKATVLGGKTFCQGNEFDVSLHYGKRIFAEQVVKAGANHIDFTGFQPLLTVVEDIIKNHSAAISEVASQVPAG